jgi:hypothetical protein
MGPGFEGTFLIKNGEDETGTSATSRFAGSPAFVNDTGLDWNTLLTASERFVMNEIETLNSPTKSQQIKNCTIRFG